MKTAKSSGLTSMKALTRDDVPDLTKKLIRCALKSEQGFVNIPYDGTKKYGEYSFYGIY